MGNAIGKVCLCSAGAGDISRRYNHDIITTNSNNPFANSICYVRPPDHFSNDDITHATTFRSVSGASVSANSSTPPSTTIADSVHHSSSVVYDSSASFESSVSFCTPLHQPALRFGPSPERGFSSVSGPMVLGEKDPSESVKKLRRSFSQNGSFDNKPENKKQIFKKVLKRVFSNSQDFKLGFTPRYRQSPKPHQVVVPVCNDRIRPHLIASEPVDGSYLDDDLLLMRNENLQWAQGRAGEDRVHIVISEDEGWVFVGIYDGFNGPDATDYLLDNLFYAVHDELRRFLCDHKSKNDGSQFRNGRIVNGKENYPIGNEKTRNVKSELVYSHWDVLVAMSEALRKTEEAFMKNVDEVISNNPVMAMMGSCVLVMVMKGQDVYLMNVGDSRAVLATTQSNDSIQLTMEHSTQVKQEVHRIRKEHPDDPSAITKGRVKGYLNVTRAFGAGFLKHPKQNNAVLESFKVKYIGEYPYISCLPSLHYHRLSPSDRFLILSSDGLHQYFTNEEAVAKVESFITSSPHTDPAQLLINEALSRAATKAGMDFSELLDIPQGERRLYHDDISVVIISFQGQIWRSSV